MSKSMDVIAGTGLDQKTRRSHWFARLDFVQSAALKGLIFAGEAARVVAAADYWRLDAIVGISFFVVFTIISVPWVLARS